VLGAGSFGYVRRAVDQQSGREVAIKVMSKKALGERVSMVENEVVLLKTLDHPNVVRFIDYYESPSSFYLVTELATGGELFDRIVEKVVFTEKDAKAVVLQLVGALNYLHENNIVHRDIKPENILYRTQDPDSDVVLADFGIAKKLSHSEPYIRDHAGSFLYAAPETYTHEMYGYKADIWSLGVVCYILMCGYSPYDANTVDDFLRVVEEPLNFDDSSWDNVGEEAKEFVLCCLDTRQETRFPAWRLLQHPWLTSDNTQKEINLISNLRDGYSAKKKLKAVIHMVLIRKRFQQLRSLTGEEEFELEEPYLSDPDKSRLLGDAFRNLVYAAKDNKEKVIKYQMDDAGR
ncbi:uncharacterized protein OGAPODRAFT_48411, partial [Ogataea polymorpha]|uniref:uncharacterized protein n=1 Tax=Ogataea polymorpha TaxID=460523 RepID=UPI0007F48FBE